MNKSKRERTLRPRSLKDQHICLLLVLTGILVRIPFLKTFDLVSYDGTYYINHARSFFDNAFSASGFPVGYPACIALLLPLVRDGVRAAQAVSLLAGLGSVVALYLLCSRFVERKHAVLAGLLLALTPLFIRLSMMTMSESLYILFLLCGLLFYAGDRYLLSGLLFGAAACTRPEAVGIFGILALLRIRRPRRLLLLLAGFAIVYAVNIIIQSYTAGRLVLLPKANLFGTSASFWKLREGWIEFRGQQGMLEEVVEEGGHTSILADYLKRMPSELLLLARHSSPVILLLGLYGIVRRRTFLIAALVPFLFFVPFTFRSEPRFILPYIPILILCAMVGVEHIRKGRARAIALALAVVSFAAMIIVNRDQLTTPVSEGYRWAKALGQRVSDRIEPGATIADRKPFFAFYAGGRYVEIPVGPYEETIDHLYAQEVEYLLLHLPTIHNIRPRLRPLIYDEAVIQGELRYRQVFFHKRVATLMRRNPDAGAMSTKRLVSADGGLLSGPVWSPDGLKIAYRMIDASGSGGIYVITAGGGNPLRIAREGAIQDPIGWSPDSKSIVYSNNSSGNMDIYIVDLSGEVYRITSHEGDDRAPSWSRDGREIVFTSTRSGASEIWSKDLETGRLSQLTRTGGASYPALSPDGRRIAFVRKERGLFVLDRDSGLETAVESPTRVYFTPSWSPDGKSIAITAKDWGKIDIYLVTARGERALLLTKGYTMMGYPSWSPDGAALAAVSVTESGTELLILNGIEAFSERLMSPVPARAFEPLE
jgi:hypothetical protein